MLEKNIYIYYISVLDISVIFFDIVLIHDKIRINCSYIRLLDSCRAERRQLYSYRRY